MRLLGADALGGVRAQSILYGDLRSFVAWRVLERRVLARRLQSAGVVLCVLSLPCVFRGASLRRCYLLAQPCGSLRRPRRDRGIASSPYSLLGFSSHPFVPPPLRYGDGGGGALRSYAALCLAAKGEGCCFAFAMGLLQLHLYPRACAQLHAQRVLAGGGAYAPLGGHALERAAAQLQL